MNRSPYFVEKERARKIVIVTLETSGRGSKSVRQRSYMAADSSDRSVSWASS